MADIDFDAVLSQVGERGRYQNRMYLLLSIPATLPAVFLAFSQVFVSATPEHWCRVPELDAALGEEAARALSVPAKVRSDGVAEFSRCERYDVNFTRLLLEGITTPDPSWNRTACDSGWNYDRSEYDETLVSQLDLVCDKSWWIATSTTCYCVGSVIGNCLMSLIGDRLGRRRSTLLVILWHCVFSIATAFLTKDYITYTALRTANALVSHALYQQPFVLTMELMGTKHRSYAGMMMCVYYSFAMAVLTLLTLVLRHWFWLLVGTSMPCLLLLSYYFFIPESPRWLLSKGRVDEAEVIVQKMAKVNGRSIPPDFLRSCQAEQAKLAPEIEKAPLHSDSYNVSPFSMLRRPLLRPLCIIIPLVWVANAVVYNGLIYNSVNLGVSDQTGFFIGSGTELLAYLSFWWIMDRLGRRIVVAAAMLIGGLSCVSCGLLPEGAVWATVTLAMLGKFCTTGSFAVFYVFAGEILPTVVRSQSIAFATFVANIGQLSFPSIVHLAVYNPVLPLLVFGAFSLCGALASALLPETLGRPLPQTLTDAETLHRSKKGEGGCLQTFCPTLRNRKPRNKPI